MSAVRREIKDGIHQAISSPPHRILSLIANLLLSGMGAPKRCTPRMPQEDGAKQVVELWQARLIGDRDLANRHGTHMTENLS